MIVAPNAGFSCLTQLAERNHSGGEVVVHTRWGDVVEAAGLHIIEAVDTVRIRDELAVLRATKPDHRAFNRRAVVVHDAARNRATRSRGRKVSEGPLRELRYRVALQPVVISTGCVARGRNYCVPASDLGAG